jgi:hypothetical protein
MRIRLAIFCLIASGLGFGQALAPSPMNVDRNGFPATGLVTVCATNPGRGTCTSLVTTYTDATLTQACIGTGEALSGQPSWRPPGVACSNPGNADADGNVVVFAKPGNYWCQYNSTGIAHSLPCSTGGGGSPPGGSNTQIQINNSGAFGAISNVDAGSALVSNGTAALPIFQKKLVVDVRDASATVGSSGVKCDGTTDDTTAIQAYFNYYGNGGSGAGQMVQMQFPAGTCKISNTLTFEGNNGLGVRIVGQTGWGGGVEGTNLAWFGPNFGTMMLILGCNNCTVDNIDFLANPIGGGKAQNALWFDASNTITPATYNLSSIARSGNIVTATTTATHAVTPGRIVKVAGSTGGATSFNGTFKVLYSNSNTTISWVQNGANESGTASTGTVTNYQSSPSNGLIMNRVKVSNPQAVLSSISSISGPANGASLTTATPHFINIGDTVIVRGVTDTTYNCAWIVNAVGSSTTATMVVVPGTTCTPDNSSSSGGTVLSGSSGIRFAHVDSTTAQISQIFGRDIFIQGDNLGGCISSLEADSGGNVKNFEFVNVIANGCRNGFEGFYSGNFNVYGYNGGLNTPDSSPQLASVDFMSIQGQVTITGAEVEASNDRFFVNTTSVGGTVHLDGISFQGSGPTDDTVVAWGGEMVITGSYFQNNRSSNTVPYLQCLGGTPLIPTTPSAGQVCSLVSHGNFYANTAVGGPSIAPGFLPFKDGSGNGWMQPGGYNINKALNVESIGDMGSLTNNSNPPVGSLNNVLGGVAAIVSSVCGGINGVATTGWLRGCNTDAINFRNNANAADVNGISKNSSDVVLLGGSAGVSAANYQTTANCSATGTAANPSVASCGAAAAGSFSCATNASTGTCVVNTTAVTANSEIFITQRSDTTTGTRLGVTCNATLTTAIPEITAVTAATSFTINLGTITTNPECFSYMIVN